MKKNNKKNNGILRWSVLTGASAILTAACLVISSVAAPSFTAAEIALDGVDYEIRTDENGNEAIYFTSDFASEEELLEYGHELCAKVESEGAALLLNENNALPLVSNAKVSLFARGAVDLLYGGTGSGDVDTDEAPTLKDALEQYGVTVNQSLWDWYTSDEITEKYSRKTPRAISDKLQANTEYGVNEAPWAEVTAANGNSFASYGDAAIVVFSRSGGEGADLPSGNNGSDLWYSYGLEGDGNYLELSREEKDLLAGLKQLKDQGVFRSIIVLVNTANALELDFLNPEICGVDYGVDACMWIGDVGQTGIIGVASLLTGEVSPSGCLVDTYCYDNLANPAVTNFYTQTYANAEEYDMVYSGYDLTAMYSVYQEGIYVGYRYYETRYEDIVMGTANAGTFNYNDVVAYTFGHGLSYTDFAFSNYKAEEKEDTFEITVTVTNTGDTYSGKKTVQIYFQSPYTEYDKTNGIEKANVELCGFAKTKVLAPGESETLTITIDKDELRAYDANNAKTYILDAGNYYFTAANNAHDASNNILAAKGYTPENTNGRMDAAGNAALTWKWTCDSMDTEIFSVSSTGKEITNLFDESDPNKSSNKPGEVTWLSRSDWEGTYPAKITTLNVNDTMMKNLANSRYDASTAPKTKMPTLEADNGLTLSMMIGRDYDDPLWDYLLDQLTFQEMLQTITLGYHLTAECESVGKPETKDENGPQGLTASLIGGESAMCYPSVDILTATFNTELANDVGRCIGEDCLAGGYSGLYGPGVNIHRTPYGGRNFEYYSEDPFVSGTICAAETKGIQSKGVYVYAKHVALNDSETSRLGVSVWTNEQAAREIYLEVVEKAVVDGGASGVMTGYNRWGTTWSGSNPALVTGFLREETGLPGMVISDFSGFAAYMDVSDGLIAGSTIWDSYWPEIHFYGNVGMANDPYMLSLMREAMHRILYTVGNSNAMNGYPVNQTPVVKEASWVSPVKTLAVVFAVLAIVSAVMLGINWKKKNAVNIKNGKNRKF